MQKKSLPSFWRRRAMPHWIGTAEVRPVCARYIWFGEGGVQFGVELSHPNPVERAHEGSSLCFIAEEAPRMAQRIVRAKACCKWGGISTRRRKFHCLFIPTKRKKGWRGIPFQHKVDTWKASKVLYPSLMVASTENVRKFGLCCDWETTNSLVPRV